MSSTPPRPFGEAHAAVYDEQADKLGFLRDALQACLLQVLASLPDEARVVCVGAGTGAEVLSLARAHPGWRFVAVDPAPAMLAICRERIDAAGLADRVTFHEGTLDSLPPAAPFDAATAVLVSQFVLDRAQRRGFFAEIARRLRPGGLLATVDLATAPGTPAFEALWPVWAAMFERVGLPAPQREMMERHVGLLAPADVAALIAAGGFEPPVQYFQALLMHGWFTRRARS